MTQEIEQSITEENTPSEQKPKPERPPMLSRKSSLTVPDVRGFKQTGESSLLLDDGSKATKESSTVRVTLDTKERLNALVKDMKFAKSVDGLLEKMIDRFIETDLDEEEQRDLAYVLHVRTKRTSK